MPRPGGGRSRRRSAGLAGALLFLAIQGGFRPTGPPSDLTAFEEVALGSRLDLLQQHSLVERLDLLEDFDVIRELDRLVPVCEG